MACDGLPHCCCKCGIVHFMYTPCILIHVFIHHVNCLYTPCILIHVFIHHVNCLYTPCILIHVLINHVNFCVTIFRYVPCILIHVFIHHVNFCVTIFCYVRQRIERFWCSLRKGCSEFLIDFFKNLERKALFNKSNALHL